jgi:DNA invertase Pin-like site-specific DNA recombinase
MPRTSRAKRDPTNLTGARIGLYCRVSIVRHGVEKSVDDQETLGREWISQQGATLAGVYRDADRSASRFATRERKEWERLVADVKAGSLDALWIWELSRAARRLTVLAQLIEDCQAAGVLLVIKDQAHDLSRSSSALVLSILGAISQMESEQISERTQRGKGSAARAGRPAGRDQYGYKRRYNQITRVLEAIVPDVFDGDGPALRTDSPAYIVREIFTRFAAGGTLHGIARDLNRRRIPTGQGAARWWPVTVRKILESPHYIGQRVYRGEVLEDGETGRPVPAMWDRLVEEETFYACQNILRDPNRPKNRPGRARWLLTWIVRCAECGGPLARGTRSGRRPYYYCWPEHCLGVDAQQLDDHVESKVIGFLSDPAVYDDLSRVDDSAAAKQARADAEQLRADLAQWRRAAQAGDVTPATFIPVEQDRLRRIAEAEQREQQATLPPALHGNIGPAVKARWAGFDVATKRQIISAVATIRVRRIGRGINQYNQPAIESRVEWIPLLGPGSGDPS